MSHHQNKVHKPKIPYLPCFTMVATGTCAFGSHCCFMHDERCLLRPKHLRKQIEHEMINHLLQYRSCKKNTQQQPGHHKYDSADHSSDEETFVQPYYKIQQQQQQHHQQSQNVMMMLRDDDSISSDEYCPEFRSAASSISFSRDAFYWPQMQYSPAQITAMSRVPYGKSKNTYSYDPLPLNDLGKYAEELSTWYYFLSSFETPSNSTVYNDRAYNWNTVTHNRRLPCFKQLAHGVAI